MEAPAVRTVADTLAADIPAVDTAAVTVAADTVAGANRPIKSSPFQPKSKVPLSRAGPFFIRPSRWWPRFYFVLDDPALSWIEDARRIGS